MDYEALKAFIEANFLVIIIAGAVLLLLLLLLILILFIKTAKLRRRYDNLMKGSDKGSLEEMILKYQERIDQTKTDTGLALEDIKLLNNQITHCLQKVGVVRFKAFEDVGSDLSYSIALLDNKNDGVILTSIFGRNMSTSYAKPILKGVSKYNLSDEEMYAMNKAMGLEKK